MSFESKQATYEQAIDDLVQSVVITENNLALAFNHYTTDGLADLLVSGKKYFKLSDRTISNEDIQQTIKDDPSFNGEMHKLIKQRKFDDAFTMLEKREYAIAWDLVSEIEQDYQETLTCA